MVYPSDTKETNLCIKLHLLIRPAQWKYQLIILNCLEHMGIIGQVCQLQDLAWCLRMSLILKLLYPAALLRLGVPSQFLTSFSHMKKTSIQSQRFRDCTITEEQ